MFSRRAVRLLVSNGSRMEWRKSTTTKKSLTIQTWNEKQKFFSTKATNSEPVDKGFTRTQPIDASGLHLEMDRDLPKLEIQDDAKQLAQEHLYGDPTEASGIDESVPAEADFIPYDPAKTDLPEDFDLLEENMAPDQHADVDPYRALTDLLIAFGVLASGMAAIYWYDPAGKGQLGPRHLDVDLVNRALGTDGSIEVPQKFKHGARQINAPFEPRTEPILYKPVLNQKQ
jgi:hypothetical protein